MDTGKLKERIYSIDFVRGVVMIIMLLDHTRDFVHTGGFDPTDLSKTNVPLFLTRWITHYCAPTFVFLSGISIYLQKQNGKSNGDLARFLISRGLWLVVLEFTIVRFGVTFNLDYSAGVFGQVIWAIGVSMIVMAALIYLPLRLVGAIGIAMILFHNLLDGFQVPFEAQNFGQAAWIILHQPGNIPLFNGATSVFFLYPLIPWIGVMAAGYAFGTVYSWDADHRRKWLYTLGGTATVLFIVIRLINIYGDPSRWAVQETPAFTILSFLNLTKYPPSLLFLLMTLGPAMIILGGADRMDGKAIWQRIAITFGRVPMFFYLLQFPFAHAMGIILSYVADKDTSHLFQGFGTAPPDAGFSLGVTYLAWIAGLILLYPFCSWWNSVKRKHKHWALSYL
jgi:uncharacterized membrane protein